MGIKISNLCLLLALLFGVANAQNHEQCTVSGRIVDYDQRPVANAYLLWDPGYEGEIDHSNISWQSDQDGQFQYRKSCPIGELRLHVTSSILSGVFTPLMPPFTDNGEISRQIEPLSIVKKENGDLNLGDVPVQIYYSTVNVHLLDASGEPLVKVKDVWKNIGLRIRDKNGKIIMMETRLGPEWSAKAAESENSTIVMQLPAGEWFIEVSITPGEFNWLKPDKLVSVQGKESPEEVSLRIDTSNDSKSKQ